MSVVVETSYRRFPFEGDPDLAQPIGMWGSEDQATGDATGGVLAITTLLSSTQQRSGNIFSIEFLHMQTSTATPIEASLELIGSSFPLAITPDTSFSLRGSGNLGAGLEARDSVAFPIFVGWQEVAATALQVSARITNVNLLVLTVAVGGYLWGARSRGVPGGPKRPAGGLWGN